MYLYCARTLIAILIAIRLPATGSSSNNTNSISERTIAGLAAAHHDEAETQSRDDDDGCDNAARDVSWECDCRHARPGCSGLQSLTAVLDFIARILLTIGETGGRSLVTLSEIEPS
jgi:hypothetical protein